MKKVFIAPSLQKEKQNMSEEITTKSKPLTIKQQLASPAFKNEVQKALPKHITSERFIRVALTAVNRTPKLLECTQTSLFKCLLDCSSLGIEPDGRRAYLIPFGKECTLIISYMGLIELCKRNGDVSNVFGAVVRQNDFFEYDLGTERKITHRPVLKDRGEILGAYAVVSFKDGEKDFEFMDLGELHEIRNNSQGYKSAIRYSKTHPWIEHGPEMMKKTTIRRLLKRQILSPEIRDTLDKEDGHEAQSFRQKEADKVTVNPFADLPEDEPKEDPVIEAETEVVE